MAPQDRYTQIGQSMPAAQPGHLFGKPCYKIGGKAFVCFFQDCMVFKLAPVARQQAMTLEGSILFDLSQSGRPMREWVQVPYTHQTLWDEFAQAALEFVAG